MPGGWDAGDAGGAGVAGGNLHVPDGAAEKKRIPRQVPSKVLKSTPASPAFPASLPRASRPAADSIIPQRGRTRKRDLDGPAGQEKSGGDAISIGIEFVTLLTNRQTTRSERANRHEERADGKTVGKLSIYHRVEWG